IQALEDEEAEAAETGEGPSHVNPANEADKEGGDTEEFVEKSDDSPSIGLYSDLSLYFFSFSILRAAP
ncbi:hypothetical protein A2U01_0081679, partial [Trifolium medium]|nr:hypothetical protein [Trifolium medium]